MNKLIVCLLLSVPWSVSASAMSKKAPKAPCVTGGCSGELCIEDDRSSAGGGIASACIYRPEFACLKVKRCERQANDSCGWTDTDKSRQCEADLAKQKPVM